MLFKMFDESTACAMDDAFWFPRCPTGVEDEQRVVEGKLFVADEVAIGVASSIFQKVWHENFKLSAAQWRGFGLLKFDLSLVMTVRNDHNVSQAVK